MSDDAVREAAYLVARGVRPLAIVGSCALTQEAMGEAATQLAFLAQEHGGGVGTIPFAVPYGQNGAAYLGYAANGTILDLLRWLCTDDVPREQHHRVLGLLLGYSPAALQHHDDLVGAWTV